MSKRYIRQLFWEYLDFFFLLFRMALGAIIALGITYLSTQLYGLIPSEATLLQIIFIFLVILVIIFILFIYVFLTGLIAHLIEKRY